jgi:hypothetical protein
MEMGKEKRKRKNPKNPGKKTGKNPTKLAEHERDTLPNKCPTYLLKNVDFNPAKNRVLVGHLGPQRSKSPLKSKFGPRFVIFTTFKSRNMCIMPKIKF